jgi:predicted Zn-dependent peptidase
VNVLIHELQQKGYAVQLRHAAKSMDVGGFVNILAPSGKPLAQDRGFQHNRNYRKIMYATYKKESTGLTDNIPPAAAFAHPKESKEAKESTEALLEEEQNGSESEESEAEKEATVESGGASEEGSCCSEPVVPAIAA